MFGDFIAGKCAMFPDFAFSPILTNFAYIHLPYNSIKLLDKIFPEVKCNTVVGLIPVIFVTKWGKKLEMVF